MTGINDWVKTTVLDFPGKLFLCPKLGKLGLFGSKIIIFELSAKLVHQIFLKFYLETVINKWVNVTVLDF